MTESGASFFGGEVPVDLALLGVGCVLPGREFAVEVIEVADASA